MSIPAGSIITVAGLNVVDRLQDVGLQNPKVPTEIIRETGNDLVLAKVPTEADFNFQLTSWDTSCDLMALFNGKVGDIAAGHGPAHEDAKGTIYRWDSCQCINIASPWKRDTGTQGGHIAAGVVIPAFFPTALAVRLGVTENAQVQATINGGAFYMSEAYPLEEVAAGDGTTTVFKTSEPARVHRIGGHGSTLTRHVFGVLVNGVIQIPGVDYVESGGGAPEGETKKVTITFAEAPAEEASVRWVYFSPEPHALDQTVHASTVTSPAAVRGRNIDILLGAPGSQVELHGVQSFELNASYEGSVQREMGQYDPIGRTIDGTDCSGTVTIEPKDIGAMYQAIAEMVGIDRSEVIGYLNEFPTPLTAVIHDPKNPTNIIKSYFIEDAVFQVPGGGDAKVKTPTQLPITWESQDGTFQEIKEALPS